MTPEERLQALKDIRWAFNKIRENALGPTDYRKKNRDAILSVIDGVRSQVWALVEDAVKAEEKGEQK